MIKNAVNKYVEFHQFEPTDIGEFSDSFSIPTKARYAGEALFVLYRSGKKDPLTLMTPIDPRDYIHEHEDGVKLYRLDRVSPSRVPNWIHEATALTLLGKCLGFAYTDKDGEEIEARGTDPLPELYCIPSGKALLVVEDKSRVVALLWGGKLRVESRGIVG